MPRIAPKNALLPVAAAIATGFVIVVGAQAGGSGTTMSKKPPLIAGYADGRTVTYLLTDVSTRKDATALRKKTGYPVAFVPRLNRVPERALAKLYLFTNGVRGPNPFGFQANILDTVPGQPGYSPLWRVYAVTWKDGASPRLLKSEEAVLAERANGQLTVKRERLIKNSPVVP